MNNSDFIFEVGLKIPSDEPARLAVASSISRAWRRVLTDPVFRRNYIERHTVPPVIGYICKDISIIDKEIRFVPLLNVPYFKPSDCGPGRWFVLDSRNGFVLLYLCDTHDDKLVVWDPITGSRLVVPVPPSRCQYFAGAVVCSHLKQFGGQFEIIFVGSDDVEANSQDADAEGDNETWVSVYSSGTGKWGVISCLETPECVVETTPPVVINGDVYFTLEELNGILKYHRESNSLTIMELPIDVEEEAGTVISVGNTLGYAWMSEEILHIYTHDEGWRLMTTITFPEISPVGLFSSLEGTSSIFTKIGDCLCTVNIDTHETKILGKAELGYTIPYQRYIIPGMVKASPEDDYFLHLSRGAVCKNKKDDKVTMFVEVDDQKLSTRALSTDKFPQIQCEKNEMHTKEEFEVNAEGTDKDTKQVKIGSDVAAKTKADAAYMLEDYYDDSSEGDDDASDEEEDQETPKKLETGKKRAAQSALKTPCDKKAKAATPSGDKEGCCPCGHSSPGKEGPPQLKTPNEKNALQAHSNAKHKAADKCERRAFSEVVK